MLSRLLDRPLASHPDDPALVAGERVWSFRQLESTAERVARQLMTLGLEPGDRVAHLLPAGPELIAAHLANFKAGLISVVVNYAYQEPQVTYALRHSGAAVLIVSAERLTDLSPEVLAPGGVRFVFVYDPEGTSADGTSGSLAAAKERLAGVGGGMVRIAPWSQLLVASPPDPLPETDSGDLAIIAFTSGTTSRPKGVVYTRRAVEKSIRQTLAVIRLTEGDSTLAPIVMLPMSTLRMQLLPTLFVGGRVAFVGPFSPAAFLATMKLSPPSFLFAGPGLLRAVLEDPEAASADWKSLRVCLSGGDRVPLDLHGRFREVAGFELTEICGMTESGPYAVNPPLGRKKRGAAGLPWYGTRIALVDEHGHDVAHGDVGEILVQSEGQMECYWNDTIQTRRMIREGWVVTGDLGRFDEDGYLWLVGRKKDMLVRNCRKVVPREVEEELLRHSAVAEAAVTGWPDPPHGDGVAAYVRLQPTVAEPPTCGELLEFLARRLESFAVPQRLTIVAKLPATFAGKLDRDRLKWWAQTGLTDL